MKPIEFQEADVRDLAYLANLLMEYEERIEEYEGKEE